MRVTESSYYQLLHVLFQIHKRVPKSLSHLGFQEQQSPKHRSSHDEITHELGEITQNTN
jgi:hypothetical protein